MYSSINNYKIHANKSAVSVAVVLIHTPANILIKDRLIN